MTLVPLLVLLAQAEARVPLAPAQIRGLRVWNQVPSGVAKAARPGEIRLLFDASFKNETPRELATVSLQLTVDLGGRPTYVSPPKCLTRFVNLSVPHTGSVLPLNKTERVRGIAFDVPERLWRTDAHRSLKVVAAEGFVNPDLHDAGHLYSWMVNGKDEAQIPFLQKNPDLLKVRNKEGLTPLLMAFGTCGPKMIRFLTSKGASPKERTARGAGIMHMAALNGYPGVMDLALKMGGDVNGRTKNGKTPLLRAIVFGRPECWRWLLAHGADPRYEAAPGYTVAQYAIHEGQREALADLVKAGVDPRTKDGTGQGWLHYAVFNFLLFDTIVKMGVPVDDANPKTGVTPLMTAAWSGWIEPQIWLLQHGADPMRKDKRGRTAYDHATHSFGNTEGGRRPAVDPEAAQRSRDHFDRLVARYSKKRR